MSRALLATATALMMLPAPARAGGLARPNVASARGMGMGSAFVAVADDPTALHYNPAGIALIPGSNVLVGAEVVSAPREYRPIFADGTCEQDPPPEVCEVQSPSSTPRPLPVLGFVTRLSEDGIPSRVSFGVGLWNTYGGALDYEPFDNRTIPALESTLNATLEIVPGVAYEVNDVLAIGAAFRIGVGLFSSKATARPSNADLSGYGLGVAGTVGVMVRPGESLSIGAVYRTALVNKINGDGTIVAGASELDVDVELDQQWPQSAGIGVAWRPTRRLMLAAEADWIGWSILDQLLIEFPGNENMNQTFLLDFEDTFAFHLGAQYQLTDALAARLGWTWDGQAVPDKTIERQFLDSNKMLYAVGASYQPHRRFRIDTAFEMIPPGGEPRFVPDNRDELGDFTNPPLHTPTTRANPAPGEHVGQLYTFELALQYLY